MAGGAGVYAGSAIMPALALHEWVVPGTQFRAPSGAIGLTFDDGPDPERTPAVLDALEAFGVLATFFVVGRRARQSPGVLRRIAAAGHAIGNHLDSHRSPALLSAAEIAREIDTCQEAVADLVGTEPRLVRPPHGHRDIRFNLAAKRRGLRPVLWTRNPRDYATRSPELLLARLRRVRERDVVLLHDGNAGAVATPAALTAFLAERRASLRFTRLE